jgi:hypothetical protein
MLRPELPAGGEDAIKSTSLQETIDQLTGQINKVRRREQVLMIY